MKYPTYARICMLANYWVVISEFEAGTGRQVFFPDLKLVMILQNAVKRLHVLFTVLKEYNSLL